MRRFATSLLLLLVPWVGVLAADPGTSVVVTSAAGRVCLDSATSPGSIYAVPAGQDRWVLILAVVVDGRVEQREVGNILGDLVPGPGPGPGPEPPPVPVPLTGLAKLVVDAAANLPITVRQLHGPKLAANYEQGASDISAGKYAEPEAAVAAMVTANRSVVGDHRSTWLLVFETMDGQLKADAKAGKLKTMEDHRLAWLEIAKGFREAAR